MKAATQYLGLNIMLASQVLSIGLLFFSCHEDQPNTHTLFQLVDDEHTHIKFENRLKDNDQFNIIQYLYYYNGGGVAAGDINNDGWTDLYFSANQKPNKLYLNRGNFQFEDITDKAGVASAGNWKTGVTMADVNGDGFLDIFVCGVGNYKNFTGKNQLLINNGDLTFTDHTKEYGLVFQGFSTHASFFDYDCDGDLDMYLLNHSVHTARSYGDASLRFQYDPLAGDKLYRNEFIPSGKIYFKEVTASAGIFNSQIGYGLGVSVSDLNRDGYPDVYVSNDFHENDYLYMNQRNGTFREEIQRAVPHTSRFSMGNDAADVNNDGWIDLITLDMLPKDEGIIKTTAGEDSYDIYQYKLSFGYHHQFSRNTMQLNRGLNTHKQVAFSDVAPLAGVEASDWSWAPLLADFDNNGYKDIFITNGIAGRPNDLDYINYISSDSAQRFLTDQQLIQQMPSGKVPNVFIQNNGGLAFKDVSTSWLGAAPSLSNGAAYSDLDNDGDLDLIVNNINERATILKNNSPAPASKFIKIKLIGGGPNRFGIGTRVEVYAEKKVFVNEQFLSRGWQSSVDPLMHFGLGNVKKIDSVLVLWPDHTFQVLRSVEVNKIVEVSQSQTKLVWDYEPALQSKAVPFLRPAESVSFVHRENEFSAFDTEKLIPRMISTEGPKIAVADVNGDKIQDAFVGGATGQAGSLFIQNANGTFREVRVPFLADSLAEDTGATFFDADKNGTLDLIVVSGGQQFSAEHPSLKPRLYLNDGRGNFRKAKKNLPDLFMHASCVKAADIDHDGDIDLFLGGRVLAGRYGIDPASYLLINDGRGFFKDETLTWFSGNRKLGMVTDAQWLDLNKDQKLDLVLVGEWMPITVFLQTESAKLENKTKDFGLDKTNGWWNTLAYGDFDNDRDIDLIAGNLGQNSRLKASLDEPLSLYIGDIDNNGGIDHLLTYYNQGKKHPFISRDQLVKQVPVLKRKFLRFENFRNVSLESIIDSQQRSKFIEKNAYTFSSTHLINQGNGKFEIVSLPIEAQTFPIFSICADDVDGDGNIDILTAGNLFSVQPEVGRYDAGYGLLLKGDGKGHFKPQSSQSSGFRVQGEGRDIQYLVNPDGKKIYLVARNNDAVIAFTKNKNR